MKKNILIRLAEINYDIFSDITTFRAHFDFDKNNIYYSELCKILDEKNILIDNINQDKNNFTFVGGTISKLTISKEFNLYSDSSESLGYRTTEVVDIYSNNLFRSKNTLYFLLDIDTQIKLDREDKLKNLLENKKPTK